jgi:hypothetical protein
MAASDMFCSNAKEVPKASSEQIRLSIPNSVFVKSSILIVKSSILIKDNSRRRETTTQEGTFRESLHTQEEESMRPNDLSDPRNGR